MMIITMFLNSTVYKVSWYGGKHHGRKTASEEIFNKNDYTCAAPDNYKFGQKLEVTNIDNGKKVVVKVNDRGGFKKHGRELDLSEAAFKKIKHGNQGVAKVTIKRL